MFNIESILAHKSETEQFIYKKKPLICFLTKTKTTTDINDHDIKTKIYNVVRCASESRHTGRVILYITKKNILNTLFWRNTI